MARQSAVRYSGDRLFASARGVDALRASLRRDPPRRIAAIAPGALGDALMTTGAVRSIATRFPGAHLALETSSIAMPLFDNFPGIAERRVRRDRFESVVTAWWLRRGAYDLGILLDDSLRRARALRWGGVRRTAGVREHDGDALLDASVCWSPDAHDRFDPLSAVLALLEADVDVRPCFFPSAADRETAARAFRELQPPPRVGIFVGASLDHKRWPLDRFIELAHRLERDGVPVVAFVPLDGGELRVSLEAAGIRVAPVLDHPLVLAEYLRHLEAFVACDSGPAHLAATAGVPVAVIYVSTQPSRGAPYDDTHTLIHSGLECDVYLDRCAGRRVTGACDRRCITAIDVDRVFAAAMALLDRRSTAAAAGTSRP